MPPLSRSPLRKVETLRALAGRFADGLGGENFLNSSDEVIEAKLTAIPGFGPQLLAIAACRRPYRSLAAGYLFLLELEFLSEFEAKP
jgi:3-methyladenine DNA glycosylase/8-oxoguanine DNA glycosylase